MIDKVLRAIKRFGMFQEGDKVCVALSGGADSVALLHVLLSLRDELSISVSAAHLNHCLRGEESDRDEQFVCELCRELDVELMLGREDVARISSIRGESVELTARKLRYDFLERSKADKIATAHTATDNAETVLLNMTRGTALRGLCGIPATRDCFVRPLIYCSRDDVEKYCKENSLSFVIDSSNLTDDYTRNRIRHNVTLVLKEINPSFDSVVGRMCESLSVDDDYFEGEVARLYAECVTEGVLSVPKGLHRALCVRLIREYILDMTDRAADSFHLNEVCAALGHDRKVELYNGFYVHVNFWNVRVVDTASLNEAKFSVEQCVCSREYFDSMLKINNLLLKNAVDYDRIVGSVTIRTRAEGDSIRLSGRNVTKSLRKLYNECKTPSEIRDILPIASDDCGVIWIKDIGVAERVAISETTEKVIFFNCVT